MGWWTGGKANMSPSIQTYQAGEGAPLAALGLRQLELSPTSRAWIRLVPWIGPLEQRPTCLHMWAAMPWKASALVGRSNTGMFWIGLKALQHRMLRREKMLAQAGTSISEHSALRLS